MCLQTWVGLTLKSVFHHLGQLCSQIPISPSRVGQTVEHSKSKSTKPSLSSLVTTCSDRGIPKLSRGLSIKSFMQLALPAGSGPDAPELQSDVIPERHPLAVAAAADYVCGHDPVWRNMRKYSTGRPMSS